MSTQVVEGPHKIRFHFAAHPWVSMFVFWLLSAVLIFLFAVAGNRTGWFGPGTGFLLMIVVGAPLLLRVPRTRHSFDEQLAEVRRTREGPRHWLVLLALFAYYREYIDTIRLNRVRPLLPLLLVGLSCWLLLAFSQALGTIVFRLSQGRALTGPFILETVNIAEDLPPRSASLFTSVGSIFEEIAWRGIFLALFLQHYSKRKAVIMAALGFSLLHLLNLAGEQADVWVLGQLVWSFTLGLWYGYSVLKTDSLIPAMIVHWFGNAFIWSLTNYLQMNASPEIQALYGVIFTLGVVPTLLLALWLRFVVEKWPVFRQAEVGYG